MSTIALNTSSAIGNAAAADTGVPVRIAVKNLNFYYGDFRGLKDISIDFYDRQVTALIGPSGCGKSTLLRTFNRIYSLYPEQRADGEILLDGQNVLSPSVDVNELRARVGMVFQKPTPFPMSIYDNIAFGPRVLGRKKGLDDLVEGALRKAALWDEVKDRLRTSALSLSGGQQQRLCIARALATEPDVLLMDEPASALDPISTAAIEDLMDQLKHEYTVVIVTHNMQQAARVAGRTAFFSVEQTDDGRRTGILVEYDDTGRIFTNPSDKRTEDYVTGRFG